MRIALKSTKPLFFPPAYKDVEIEMDIELIQNNPVNQTYTLKICDRAYKEVEETITEFKENEETKEVEKVQIVVKERKQVGKTIVRGLDKEYSYEELNQLAQQLGVQLDDESKMAENINELFRLGFLAITNMECQLGEGLYGAEVGDFKIIE